MKHRNLLQTNITTDRLILRAITPEDAEAIFTNFTPKVAMYLRPQPTGRRADTVAFIDAAIKAMRQGTELQIVVADRDTGEFMGCAGVHHIDTSTPELGIWLKTSAHGRGLGTEVIAALVHWAHANVTFEYLLYPVYEPNTASRKVVEKLGGVEAGRSIKANAAGKELTSVMYHISRGLTPQPPILESHTKPGKTHTAD